MGHPGRSTWAASALLCLMLAPGVAPAEESKAMEATLLVPIRNARIPLEGVLSGGQPTPGQLEAAARAGFRTVINLRAETEAGFEWEREAVDKLGMRYRLLPIAGKADLTPERVRRFDEALTEAREAGPVLLHCASGNRIGAIFALRAAWLYDTEPEVALQHGKDRGMTSLEPHIRGLLDLEAD